jgi:hypothetical protein
MIHQMAPIHEGGGLSPSLPEFDLLPVHHLLSKKVGLNQLINASSAHREKLCGSAHRFGLRTIGVAARIIKSDARGVSRGSEGWPSFNRSLTPAGSARETCFQRESRSPSILHLFSFCLLLFHRVKATCPADRANTIRVSWTVSSISDSMVGDCAITSPQNVLTLSNVKDGRRFKPKAAGFG